VKLEFKIYKLKESSKMYEQLIGCDSDNQFIIVGEDNELGCYHAHQLDNGVIMIIGGLSIKECSLLIYKDDLEIDADEISCMTAELDIPKNNLAIDIIDDIKRLNN